MRGVLRRVWGVLGRVCGACGGVWGVCGREWACGACVRCIIPSHFF